MLSDQFANYVFQKMLEKGTEDQQQRLVSQLKGRLLELSADAFGCWIVQKAIDWGSLEELVFRWVECMAFGNRKVFPLLASTNPLFHIKYSTKNRKIPRTKNCPISRTKSHKNPF